MKTQTAVFLFQRSRENQTGQATDRQQWKHPSHWNIFQKERNHLIECRLLIFFPSGSALCHNSNSLHLCGVWQFPRRSTFLTSLDPQSLWVREVASASRCRWENQGVQIKGCPGLGPEHVLISHKDHLWGWVEGRQNQKRGLWQVQRTREKSLGSHCSMHFISLFLSIPSLFPKLLKNTSKRSVLPDHDM